ncbi:MAG: glycine cleavage system aminomethyltransferase GcvT [Chloroflexi bacterium]|nr:glycine cleavage system aminomethyltransferase GcvT [Chloroflexota bacterium]
MDLKRTPLFDWHTSHGARMVDFGGWEMPVQYTSILEEHRAVRQKAGLFDVCHMGEAHIRGPQAGSWLRHIVTNDPAMLEMNQAQYNVLCQENGTALDDLIIYRLGEDHFLAVLNASNVDKDVNWLREHLESGVTLENASDETGLMALQGPAAEAILQKLTAADLSQLRYYWCLPGKVADVDALICRTGYTGEDGFEVMVPSDQAMHVWEVLMQAGESHGLLPAGLGARDTLRLEAAMPLYGHELDEETTPLEAGLTRFIVLDKDFIGRDAMREEKASGLKKRLVGIEMVDRGIPRQDYAVLYQGEVVGKITSGTMSPTLEKAIAMAYVRPDLREVGTELAVMIRDRPAKAVIARRPFYKR